MNQTSILFDKVNYLLLAKAMVLVGILFRYLCAVAPVGYALGYGGYLAHRVDDGGEEHKVYKED